MAAMIAHGANVTALPLDVLMHIARKGGAVVLVKMLQLCQTWRTNLLGECDTLWQTFALGRFSRLRLLIKHAPMPCDFKLAYRQQLLAEQGHQGPAAEVSYPALDAYIFVVEVRNGEDPLGSWSGVVASAGEFLPIQWVNLPCHQLMREEVSLFRDYGRRLRDFPFFESISVSISVTRRSDYATIILYDTEPSRGYRFEELYFEVEGERVFDEFEPPQPSGIGIDFRTDNPPKHEVVFGGEGYNEDHDHHLEMAPGMLINLTDGAESGVYMNFMESIFYYDSGESNALKDKDLRKYLFLAPWPTVP